MTYGVQHGDFNERLFYEKEEVEKICSAELRAVGLYPEKPEPIRIDRFLEKKFGSDIIRYEDVPNGILGFTVFGPNGVEQIVVDRSLDEDKSTVAERRIRTTMAHEGGHGLLHIRLFTPNTSPRFADITEPDKPKIMCRDELKPDQSGYKGHWWEYQANMAMGALLLPSALVYMALEPFLIPCGLFGIGKLDNARRNDAIKEVAETFNVNGVVARHRLDQLYPVNDRQLTL